MDDKRDKKEIPSVNNDYDPYSERDVPNPTNDLESLAHITKGILGTGVLALPEGFSYAGGVLAVIFCLVSGLLCTVGMHILVNGMYKVCKAFKLPVISYSDAMKLGVTLGPRKIAKHNNTFAQITNAFIIIYQGGVLCVYMLFVAVMIEKTTNNVLGREIPLAFYLLIMVIPCMLINAVKNLKYLAPFSYFSLGVTLMVLIMIFYYVFRDGTLPDYDQERKYASDFLKLPIFFGTTLFAFTAVAVSVSVENNMKNPSRFYILYDISVGFLVVLYLSIGFFSYWKWGDELESVVILNFPLEEIAARLSNYLCALAIYLSLGLNGIVPVKLLMDNYILKKLESPHPILWEYVLRLGFIALGLFLAITVPYVGTIVSLLGAIALSFLSLVFPSILDICWRYQEGYGKLKYRLIIDIFMISFGIFGLLTGVYTNIMDLYDKMSKAYTDD